MSEPKSEPEPMSRPGHGAPRQIARPAGGSTGRESTLRAFREAMTRVGLDVDDLQGQQRCSRAALAAEVARHRAAAEERAPALEHAVAAAATNWLAAHRMGAALAPSGTSYYSVDTTDHISADAGLDLRAEHVGPWTNTAEVVFDVQTDDIDSFDGKVSFTFSWANPTGQDLLCTVTGMFGVAATVDATADSYWWPLNPTPPASEIAAYTWLRLNVVDSAGTITVPAFQDTQFQQCVDLVTFGDWSEGTIVGQDINRGYVLQYLNLFVPASTRIEAELACEISWHALDGGGQFVAAGNGRKLSGFGLFITAQS
jgi:hypothetical protein